MKTVLVMIGMMMWWHTPCFAVGKSTPMPREPEVLYECATVSGQMELCEQESYKDTCRLLRVVSRAICDAPLAPDVGVLIFIPPENPQVVVVLATFGERHKRSWIVNAYLDDEKTPPQRRALTDLEIFMAAEEVARRVKERTRGWVLEEKIGH